MRWSDSHLRGIAGWRLDGTISASPLPLSVYTYATDPVLTEVQVSAVISVALYPVAVNAGLGRHIDELDAKSVSQYFKVRLDLSLPVD